MGVVILLTDQTEYYLTDARGEMLKELLKGQPNPSRLLDLHGDKSVMVAVKQIAQVMSDEQFDEHDHKRKGDWKCDYDHWHLRSEWKGMRKYCAHAMELPKEDPPIDLSYLRQAPAAEEDTTVKDRWKRLIAINHQIMRESGHYGTLLTLEDLDLYEEDGTLPELGAKRRELRAKVASGRSRLARYKAVEIAMERANAKHQAEMVESVHGSDESVSSSEPEIAG
jgi:hypothetical protein